MTVNLHNPSGTILLVDDEPANLRLLSEILAEQGYTIRATRTGREALAAIEAEPPDIVLLGVRLPDITGHEICSTLQANTKTRPVPVILLSAVDDTVEKLQEFSAGAVDYITKPFNTDEVLARVRTHLEISCLRSQLQRQANDLFEKNGELQIEITERKLSEQALRESEERLRLALDATSDALWDWDLRTGKVYRSPRYYELVGRRPEEDRMDFAFFIETVHPDDLSQVLATIEAHKQGKTSAITFDFRLANRSGPVQWLRVKGRAVEREGRAAPLRMVGTLSDITGQKQVEEELRESRAQLDAALASMTDAVFISDSTGQFLEFNDAFASFHRFENKAQCMKHLTDYPDILEVYTADGQPAPLASWAVPRALQGETVTNAVYTLRRRDTGESWVGSYSFGPIRDKEGEIVGSVVVGRDITEIQHNEETRKILEAQLQQVQKLEAVGKLAGGVAHDFNNMLSVILGHAEMAMDRIDPSLTLFDHLREIRTAAQRSTDICRQLLAFARKQTIIPKVIDLNAIVEGMLKMLRRLLGEDIYLIWIPGRELWQIKVDPSQIDQILANLCVNARDAIADVGKITVETENTTFDADYCTSHAGFMAGEYVMIAISDTGCGMTQETQAHIFEPFFTTKGIGEGTGLGLATVYGAVKQNNGFINVYSEPGQGTIFRIYLPRYVSTTGEIQLEEESRLIAGGHETILLVEDEPTILNITKAMLQQLGYSVMAAGDPRVAINLAEEFHDTIHLLITDMIMPEMNGRELKEKLLGTRTGMKCLYMSGYTADIIARQGVLEDGINFLRKPFSKKELAAKVRKAIDG